MYSCLEDIKQKYYILKNDINLTREKEILKIFNEEEYNVDPNDSFMLNILGIYYEKVKQDYVLMEKYYLMAIELNNSDAMNGLGYYHKNITKNYKLMEKYYLMAIVLNNSDAMNSLGNYYYNIKNYKLMEKYYLMAIDLNNSDAMNGLANYYRYITYNHKLIEKYYLMAIELNNYAAFINLNNYYYYKPLKLFLLLNSVYNKSNNISNKINVLKTSYTSVKKYLSKFNIFDNINNKIQCNHCKNIDICIFNNNTYICNKCYE
jgi:TPR repeat protein